MRLLNFSTQSGLIASGPAVLLASADTLLALDLERIFHAQGWRAHISIDAATTLAELESLENPAVILLDVRLDGALRLLAAMHESGIHKRCAIAVIAEHPSDEWFARLREGAIDDIAPRNADASA